MKLIDEIIIKADCVEIFLRDLCKKYDQNTFIVDVIMQPHKFQGIFDKWREDNGYDSHPMDRPNKIGKVKDILEDECTHENIEHQEAEYDTNVSEAYTCEDCGTDLDPPPEPDWDLLAKEERI